MLLKVKFTEPNSVCQDILISLHTLHLGIPHQQIIPKRIPYHRVQIPTLIRREFHERMRIQDPGIDYTQVFNLLLWEEITPFRFRQALVPRSAEGWRWWWFIRRRITLLISSHIMTLKLWICISQVHFIEIARFLTGRKASEFWSCRQHRFRVPNIPPLPSRGDATVPLPLAQS